MRQLRSAERRVEIAQHGRDRRRRLGVAGIEKPRLAVGTQRAERIGQGARGVAQRDPVLHVVALALQLALHQRHRLGGAAAVDQHAGEQPRRLGVVGFARSSARASASASTKRRSPRYADAAARRT